MHTLHAPQPAHSTHSPQPVPRPAVPPAWQVQSAWLETEVKEREEKDEADRAEAEGMVVEVAKTTEFSAIAKLEAAAAAAAAKTEAEATAAKLAEAAVPTLTRLALPQGR